MCAKGSSWWGKHRKWTKESNEEIVSRELASTHYVDERAREAMLRGRFAEFKRQQPKEFDVIRAAFPILSLTDDDIARNFEEAQSLVMRVALVNTRAFECRKQLGALPSPDEVRSACKEAYEAFQRMVSPQDLQLPFPPGSERNAWFLLLLSKPFRSYFTEEPEFVPFPQCRAQATQRAPNPNTTQPLIASYATNVSQSALEQVALDFGLLYSRLPKGTDSGVPAFLDEYAFGQCVFGPKPLVLANLTYDVPIGSEVELHGLKTTSMNGRVGTVLEYHVVDPAPQLPELLKHVDPGEYLEMLAEAVGEVRAAVDLGRGVGKKSIKRRNFQLCSGNSTTTTTTTTSSSSRS